MLLVTESATGRSFRRSGGAEYATTKKRLSASTTHDTGDPTMTRNTMNGAQASAAAQSVARCSRGSSTAPCAPPLRGLRRSDA